MSQPAERTSTETVTAGRLPEAPAESTSSVEARPTPREPQFEEVVLPASSVLGLQVETPLSSERTRIEDRVDARVTRDVTAGGRVAIPSGSRVIGSVTLVERGGKMKERARLGVRFHTLVLADGREVPLRTEAIIREGDSPSNESARKIGGAAIGGAILGAIMGGGKGAMVGSAAGAAGGSAAVMAGDRNAATLPAGTIVSVRLAAPATIEVERPAR
jgi:type IV secretory pathway VirB10-like protein